MFPPSRQNLTNVLVSHLCGMKLWFVRSRSDSLCVSFLIWILRASARFVNSCTITALWSNPQIVKSPSKPAAKKQWSPHPMANIGGAVPVFMISNPFPADIVRQTHSCGKTSGDEPRERRGVRPLWHRRWSRHVTSPRGHGASTAEVELRTPRRVRAVLISPSSLKMEAREYAVNRSTKKHPCFMTIVTPMPMYSTSPTSPWKVMAKRC